MSKPRAVYYRILKYQPENRERLNELFEVVELDDPRQDSDEVLRDAHAVFAPLGFEFDAAKIDRCTNLRAIVSNTTGIPHIDDTEAARRGVVVCALHDDAEFLDGITPTAELTIGLIVAASRKLPAAHSAAASGAWDRRPWGAPAMLSRLRLGIVGYGRLGQKVARAAGAFDMTVRFYDPGKPGSEDTLVGLAAVSDVLSLHAPATKETAGMVSRNVLAALPPGAIVVNTARGELIDTDALLDLLESGHLYAAALDAVAGEYEPDFARSFGDSRLARYARANDNLILTPHIGGSTVDAWRETERRVIDRAAEVLGIVDQ